MVDIEEATKLVGGIVTAIIGGAFLLRKLQATWTKDGGEISENSTRIKSNNISMEVILLMRDELTRMSNVNTDLANKVNAFQTENIKLHSDVSALKTNLEDMARENSKLYAELENLQGIILDLKQLIKASGVKIEIDKLNELEKNDKVDQSDLFMNNILHL
jgi:regulator of replication initiation timing